MTDQWGAVAAEGTDDRLLARVVARLLGPRGDPRTVLRELVARAVSGREGVVDPGALLAAIAPEPDVVTREAAAVVARRWALLGVRAALAGDPAYPHRLLRGWPATGGPPLFAWRGPPRGLPDRPRAAIVGARRATAYGTGVAAWLAEAAGAAGVTVVSGGAIGIDAAAHGGALGTAGGTAVVLGCGHAVGYPMAHARPGGLFDRVLAAGGWLVSELPPDSRPTPANVLARNRIVAGLVDVVVVVEGGARSGALRTAEVAADRGITVLAVPGDVRAPGSAAPHRLLADGAAPCCGPADLLAALGDTATAEVDPEPAAAATASVLPPEVTAVLGRRWPRPTRLDELARASQVPAGRLLALLTRARVAGEVAESVEGVRLSRAPDRHGHRTHRG